MKAFLSKAAQKSYANYKTFDNTNIWDIEELVIAAGKTRSMERKRIFTMFLWMLRDVYIPIQFWKTPNDLKHLYPDLLK